VHFLITTQDVGRSTFHILERGLLRHTNPCNIENCVGCLGESTMVHLRKLASQGKHSDVGQERRGIYASAWTAINHAVDQKCWLEVIALSESIIADRLEARIAHIGKQSEESRKLRTASQSASHLLRESSLSLDERHMLESVKAWSKLRNTAIHELAKAIDGSSVSWEQRWLAAQDAATAGMKIARLISRSVKNKNK